MNIKNAGIAFVTIMSFCLVNAVIAFGENAVNLAPSVEIEMTADAVKPGETASVSFSIKNNPGITGVEMLIDYGEELKSPEIYNSGFFATVAPLFDDSLHLLSVVAFSGKTITGDLKYLR